MDPEKGFKIVEVLFEHDFFDLNIFAGVVRKVREFKKKTKKLFFF